MSKRAVHSFSVSLLTLLFLWVGTFSAFSSTLLTDVSFAATCTQETCHEDVHVPERLVSEVPGAHINIHITSDHPSLVQANVGLQEKDETSNEDKAVALYFMVLNHLTSTKLEDTYSPVYIPQQQHFTAVRNQSTYLLDCVFLI